MSTPAWKKAQRQAEHQQLKLQKEREKNAKFSNPENLQLVKDLRYFFVLSQSRKGRNCSFETRKW